MTDIAMQTTTVDGVTKYTIAFPLTDDQGQPILDRHGKPRFTNLIADSPEGLVSEIAKTNLEVTRALDRANKHIDTLKNKKPTAARPAPVLRPAPLTADETLQVGLDLQDPRKAAAAVEKVVESRVAPVAGEVERHAQTIDIEARRRVAREFFGRHPEYNTAANGSLLAKWLVENGYEFTLDNIEIAFATLQDRLAPIPAPRNEPPANAAPGNEPPNPGNPPTPTRRPPVGGITNTQASGVPGSQRRLTRQQALDMLYKNRPEYEAWMADPVKNKILCEALAGR